MRKIIGLIFALIALTFVFSACGGDTYAKRVDREKKAIKRFLADNDIEVLDVFPKVFKKNQYYKDSKTGVYIHVVDSGTGKKAIQDKPGWSGTTITMHCDSVRTLNDTLIYRTTGGIGMQFQYGRATTYKSNNQYSVDFIALSPACTIVLEQEHIREGAIIKMLVPFATNVGSAMQELQFEPLYYGRLEYTHFE